MRPHDLDFNTTAQNPDRPQSGADETAGKSEKPAAQDKPFYEFTKRVFDIIGSFLGGIVLLPVFAVISFIIWAGHTGKHVIYKQKRIGRYGREVYIYKFRSMVDDADNVERWLDKNQLKQY